MTLDFALHTNFSHHLFLPHDFVDKQNDTGEKHAFSIELGPSVGQRDTTDADHIRPRKKMGRSVGKKFSCGRADN